VGPRTGLDEVVRRNIPSLYRDILRDFSYFTGPDVRSWLEMVGIIKFVDC
jgi:hypothetical protein